MSQPSSDNVSSTLPARIPAAHPVENHLRHEDPQRTLSVSMRSETASASPYENELALKEVEDDDLSLLDIPDLPKSITQQNDGSHLPNVVVSPPASLTSMPLPANFVVADALYPIPPPGPEDGERCQSKYLRGQTSKSICEHISASKFWKDHKDDTVFLTRPGDEAVIHIDEARAQLKHRRMYGETNSDLNRQTRSLSQNGNVRKDSSDVLSQVEKLEREIAEMKEKMRKKTLAKAEQTSPSSAVAEPSPSVNLTNVKEEQASPPQSATVEVAPKFNHNTEELLAALGVTGSPKPVTAPNMTYGDLQYSPPPLDRNSNDTPRPQELRNGDHTTYSSISGLLPPPPPPPPSFQQMSLPDGMDGSPTSTELGDLNGHAVNTNGVDSGNGYYSTGPDGEMLSPDQSRYENARGRKRSHNRRDSSSDEDDVPARRQEDDVTPKLKRRQPKVAAAYR